MPRIIKTTSPVKPKVKKTKKNPNSALAKVQPKLKTPSPKSSPIDYYHCLMNYAQQGFYDEGKKQKIHACCKKCKLTAPALNQQRDQELVKLITSYRQVGDSLKKLLRPVINE